MTFSIVARSEDALGVATATRSLAVGSIVPAVAPGVGAVATQARTNRAFRARGLQLMGAGVHPEDVLTTLAQEDPGFAERQVALVDATGRSAVWTGRQCLPWAGGWARPGLVVAGNILVGRQVLEAMEEAFDAAGEAAAGDAAGEAAGRTPLARRLHAALQAGDRAGGARRGRQSAAVVVVPLDGPTAWPPTALADLRVDDHPDPVDELARLLDLHESDRAGRTPLAAP